MEIQDTKISNTDDVHTYTERTIRYEQAGVL